MKARFEVISRYYDGTLSDNEFATLESWILASELNAAEFIRMSSDHSALRDMIGEYELRDFSIDTGTDGLELLNGEGPIRPDVIGQLLDEEMEAEQRRANEERGRTDPAIVSAPLRPGYDSRRRNPEPIVIPWSVVYSTGAAVAVGLIFLLRAFWPDGQEAAVTAPVVTPQHVAVISNSVDARWGKPELSTSRGTVLLPGNLMLASGFVEIQFNGGAQLIVQAPAELELLSADRIRLTDGILVSKVPHEAIGFTVKTPTATVVDLGTEFGVIADKAGASQVHVLDGEVQVVSGGDHASTEEVARTKLSAGEAVAVGQDGALTSIPLESATLHRDVPTIISFHEVIYPTFDARLVDADGDGQGDNLEPLDEPRREIEDPSESKQSQPLVGVGERNNPGSPDDPERRYCIVFDLNAEQFKGLASAKSIDTVLLSTTLSSKSHVDEIRLDVLGIEVDTVSSQAVAFHCDGTLLTDDAFDATTKAGVPRTIDVTDFVKERLRSGDSQVAFRFQASGDDVPNQDGLTNCYVFHTTYAEDESVRPQLRITARKYSSPSR